MRPPVEPMLATLGRQLPEGSWFYEPKWDGFRCVAFRDDAGVVLCSRRQRPMQRYFPEVVDAWRESVPRGSCSTASWWWPATTGSTSLP